MFPTFFIIRGRTFRAHAPNSNVPPSNSACPSPFANSFQSGLAMTVDVHFNIGHICERWQYGCALLSLSLWRAAPAVPPPQCPTPPPSSCSSAPQKRLMIGAASRAQYKLCYYFLPFYQLNTTNERKIQSYFCACPALSPALSVRSAPPSFIFPRRLVQGRRGKRRSVMGTIKNGYF